MKKNHNISIVTLGCAKNEVDSDKMAALLLSAGYEIENDTSKSDVININTCAFLQVAVEEGIDVIFHLRSQNKTAKIIVSGCMPSRYSHDLTKELFEVDKFVPVKQQHNIVNVVNALLDCDSKSSSSSNIRTKNQLFAYVKISDGCNRFCSYCAIPYIRGRYFSFSEKEIMKEVAELVENGTKEIIFIAQDTGIWGSDFNESTSIVSLLDIASSTFSDTWFRLLYIQPDGITDDLLDLISSRSNICSYLDMPIQHVNADILKKMNRTGDYESLRSLVNRIRLKIPDVAIRTTCMVGFPTENDNQFSELIQYLEEVQLDYTGHFAFSAEEGTKAYKLQGQLPENIKLQRAQKISDVSEVIGFNKANSKIGKVYDVLIEGYEKTDTGIDALGRYQGQAPDVDGQVHIPIESFSQISIGDIVTVEIVDSFCYELVGEVI